MVSGINYDAVGVTYVYLITRELQTSGYTLAVPADTHLHFGLVLIPLAGSGGVGVGYQFLLYLFVRNEKPYRTIHNIDFLNLVVLRKIAGHGDFPSNDITSFV